MEFGEDLKNGTDDFITRMVEIKMSLLKGKFTKSVPLTLLDTEMRTIRSMRI